jgi:hypothetical protein
VAVSAVIEASHFPTDSRNFKLAPDYAGKQPAGWS